MAIFFLIWLIAGSTYLFAQTLSWKTSIDSSEATVSGTVVRSDGKTAVFHNNGNNGNSSKIQLLDGTGYDILWEKTFNNTISGMVPHPSNKSIYIVILDSIFQFDQSGQIIYSNKVPTTTNQKVFLSIGYDQNNYVIVDGGSHNYDKVVAIYDFNNNLMSNWYVPAYKEAESISINQNAVIISFFRYGGGTYSNASSSIVAYNHTGNILWSDSLPDVTNNRNGLDNEGNVYFTGTHISDNGTAKMSWLVNKYSSKGQKLWFREWDGDNNYLCGDFISDVKVIPGNGGCIVAGGTTRMLAPANDPNQYQGTIKAFSANGDTLWKIIYDDDSKFYCSWINSIAWDKNNNLIGLHTGMFWETWPHQNFLTTLLSYSIPSITAVKSEPDITPESFSLSQNYPNPWNPTTTINYSHAKEGHIRLTVYNSLGSQIATIVDADKPAGNYSVKFDGNNLASGIYFYRLESAEATVIKKMMLMK